MDKQLKHIKEEINDELLNHITFKEQHIHQVLHSINKPKPSKKFQMKNKFGAVLSFAVVTLMISGISFFVGTQLQQRNDEKNTADENKVDEKKTGTKKEREESVYIPPDNEENYEDMTKVEILTKMINSIDYFETAKGKYQVHYSFYEDHAFEIVEYSLSMKNQLGGYGITTNEKGEIREEYYNGEKVWMLSDSSKTYREFQASGWQLGGTTLTLDQAFSMDSEGTPYTDYRERPPFSAANATLFPYEIASNYTRDLTQWEIENQNEELLGHNTLVIKGIKYTRDFQSFRFWVDKDTGILLKYETYNGNGEVVDYLHPLSLEVNIPVNSEIFSPDLEGYEEEKDPINVVDPREAEVVHVAGTKSPEEINDVFALMKKDMPFLFEFTHPDLQLSSASYETFKDYKIGYLYYMLDRDGDKNSSQMLSVRVHHKDSYVRSIGSFELIGDTKISPFSLNDIQWEGTVMNDGEGDWVHLTGEKGEYIYDVVSQHISLKETKEFLGNFKAAE
jgi:outer membrane lipoprotein-sorting protein